MSTETTKGRVIDLDALDREDIEPGYRKEKLGLKVDEVIVYLTDPKELDWAVVVTMDETPRRFFAAAIEDPAEKRHILEREKPLKLWQLQYLMEQYRNHYGIDREGNAVASRR